MKHVTAFHMRLLLCLSFVSGGLPAAAAEPTSDEAWRAAEDPALSEELRNAFAQAAESLLGVFSASAPGKLRRAATVPFSAGRRSCRPSMRAAMPLCSCAKQRTAAR